MKSYFDSSIFAIKFLFPFRADAKIAYRQF
jgi:hypothetical protein